MSIYLNNGAEKAAVKALGEDIGFGRIIQLAHQCWDEMLEAKHGIKGHREIWTLASADLIRERRAAPSSETTASPMGAISDQGKDTRDEQTASLLSRLKEATADAAAYAETAKAQREWKEEAEAALQAAQARIKVLEGDKARLDWLEMHDLTVRDPLVHGSRHMFFACVDDGYEGEERPSDLRAKVDAEIARSALPQLGGENG